jgi:DNA-binding NarL/FixJ family response regulator
VAVGQAWPLVGRDDHLAAIRGATGRAAGVLIVGTPGSGRTRLAREAGVALGPQYARTVGVGATPWTRETPMGAFVSRLPELAGDGDDAAALHRARELLRGTLLLVDDVHLLDPLGARLVHDLARHREAFVVLTARASATLPEPVLALRVGARIERVDVGDLDVTAAAAAHRGAGRSGAAVTAGERARAWLERCEEASTPALHVRVADELTAREREIAELAATGMASRAIAERLVLSVRTVDNALGSAYAKLGVKGRAELRSVFSPRRV